MLVSLHVKNLALIDETEIHFGEGLNILSGETGAGKSILIGSINLALGAKADKDLIRTGAEYALIELVFCIEEQTQLLEIAQMDIPAEEDGMFVIKRRLTPSRSVCQVNGETVSAKQLQRFARVLLDIHGQHEHQSLLYKKKHFAILDSFAGAALSGVKENLEKRYVQYAKLKEEWEDAQRLDAQRERELGFVRFEADEIENAKLQPDEDKALEQAYGKMANARKIMEAVSFVHNLTGYETGAGAGESLGRALRELKGVTAYDEGLRPLETQLVEIDALLNDFNRDISEYKEGLDFAEADFERAHKRLNEINGLKAKYGGSIPAILEYAKEKRHRIEQLENYEAYLGSLQKQMDDAAKELKELCKKASLLRKEAAGKLQQSMTEALQDLNFLKVQFAAAVTELEHFTKTGCDDVEFLISTNPGEPLKPLGHVASGGELSRIMLALKTVLAKDDKVDTLIFDEIDAGISGKTAWKVSQKLGLLGQTHQVICITHLPQIAAMADTHFLIEKSSDENATKTQIYEIGGEAALKELARLLGGLEVTDAVLENAKEMKELAANAKQSQSKF